MGRWYSSDLHFGHRMLVQRGHRPFSSTAEMDECLVTLWNEMVAPADEVWILGDLAMHPVDEGLMTASKLNGRKHLVPGNHDMCWTGAEARRPQALKWQMRYRHIAGIAQIVDSGPLRFPIHDLGGTPVALSHFPYTEDHTSEVRYPRHRLMDRGGWLLHGHLHDKWRLHGRQVNVGVDAWGLRPVHADVLADCVHKGPYPVPAPPLCRLPPWDALPFPGGAATVNGGPIAQSGRALALQAGGPGFNSRWVHSAGVAEWQTRQVESLIPSRECRFESCRPHRSSI